MRRCMGNLRVCVTLEGVTLEGKGREGEDVWVGVRFCGVTLEWKGRGASEYFILLFTTLEEDEDERANIDALLGLVSLTEKRGSSVCARMEFPSTKILYLFREI